MHQSEINSTAIIEPRVTKTRWFNQITDSTLRELIKETYSSMNADNHILATIGNRAALERTMILLGASENIRGFTAKLEQLEKNNVIEKKERELLQWLIGQGNLAAHEGYRPTLSELTKITMLVQVFIRRTMINTHRKDNLDNKSYDRKNEPHMFENHDSDQGRD